MDSNKDLKIIRSNNDNADFLNLVKLLDKELANRDGEDHTFFAQFNKVDFLKNVIIVYKGENPIGCGAFKEFDQDSVEIKRMYVLENHRNNGIAVHIIHSLEYWAKELGFSYAVLETGIKQPEAIRLYQKSGYQVIPNYGQYSGIENSICFKKTLESSSDLKYTK